MAIVGRSLTFSFHVFLIRQDTWFSYARLEEDAYRAAREDGEQLNPDKVRDIYERAVAQVPPGSEKRLWRRYIFLWLFYATFEEIETKVRRILLR